MKSKQLIDRCPESCRTWQAGCQLPCEEVIAKLLEEKRYDMKGGD